MSNKKECYISLWEIVVSEGFREKFSEKDGQKSEVYPCFTLLLGENILIPFSRIIYPFSIHYIFYLKKIQRNKRMDGKLGLIDHTPSTLVKHISNASAFLVDYHTQLSHFFLLRSWQTLSNTM